MPDASASSEPHANVPSAVCQRQYCHSHVFGIQGKDVTHTYEVGSE